MTGGTRPVEDLEARLGDPFDERGEFSYGRILAADSDRRLVGWAEAVLQDWGFSAELVPNRLGGRWISTEDMVRRLSPIFRRDPALGLGHGVTTLMAACNVWAGGDEQAQTGLASRLLNGDRVAVAFHELAHGNDLLGNELIAEQTGAGLWRVSGRKEVINNIDRAPAALLFARTGQTGSAGASAFSLLLWEKSVVLGGSADTTARVWTTGVRGCQIGVATFDGLMLPSASLIGTPGDGVATALRAFQVTRSVVPALACATLSAAIGMSVPYMTTRGLYGGTVWDLPHARGLLVRAWARLIVGDALARVSVRSLHVRPDESFLLSAATKYLVPELLNQAMQHLTTLFGSSFYTVSAPYGAIEKWLRDLAVVPIGHAGSRSCLQSLVPNLPTWARRSRRHNTAPPELFSSCHQLGELDFSGLTIGAGKFDSLVGVFEDEAVKNALSERFPDLKDQMDDWAEELSRLREDASALRPAELGADASPDALAAGRRQALLFAAAALVGTWLHNRHDVNSAFHGSGTALRAGLALLADLRLESAPLTTGVLTDVVATGWSADLELAAAEHIRRTYEAGRSLGIEELPLSVAPDRYTETSEEP